MINQILNGDCLELMKDIPDKSIDLILTDLPYGTTKCQWDQIIPFDKLWKQYERIIKDNGAIILTASQPFTTDLIMSNRKLFRYEIIWDKTKSGNFALANKQPLKSHENTCVFYKKQPIYNPQKEIRGNIRKKGGGKPSDNFGITPTISFNNEYFPKSIIQFSTGSRKEHFHTTQKPVALFEYLIKTYTNEGMTVLDNCSGSGTNAIACINTNRNYICIEKDKTYFDLSIERVKNHTKQMELIPC